MRKQNAQVKAKVNMLQGRADLTKAIQSLKYDELNALTRSHAEVGKSLASVVKAAKKAVLNDAPSAAAELARADD